MPEPILPHTLSTAHVLIVEDEALILMDIEDTIKAMGFSKVTGVMSVERALKVVDEDPVDLALIDIHIAGGDSYAVATALRTRGIPFVFSSGTESADLPQGFATVPFVDKPYSLAALQDALTSALGAERGGSAGC